MTVVVIAATPLILEHVGSAIEALDVMAGEPADMLLCDVNMREYDGLWLAAQVHARAPVYSL